MNGRGRWSAAACLLLVALGFAASACGGARFHVIAEEDLPRDLYSSPTPPPPAADLVLAVYFAAEGRLAPVARSASSRRNLAEQAIRALLGGPSPAEMNHGLTTAIPPGTRLLSIEVRAGQARVNLSSEFELGAEERLVQVRLAQVVYTVTAVEDVSRVEFAIDGENVNVSGADGVQRVGAVSRGDYASLGPPERQVTPDTPNAQPAAGRSHPSGT